MESVDNLKGKKILVTGGSGFIGSHLVQTLKESGASVESFDLKEGNDIFDRPRLREALQEVDIVFHLAAKVSVPESVVEPLATHATNVSGTVVVLEESRLAGVSRVVYSGSCAVYGDEPTLPKNEDSKIAPLSPYALTKYLGEEYCRMYHSMYGLETVVLRYMNVIGPGQSPSGPYAAAVPIFIDRMQKGEPVTIYGDGGQTRDFVYVGDVVEANLRAATTPGVAGETFLIASGKETSINDVIATLEKVSGKTIEKHYEPARPGDIVRSVGDSSKAKAKLNLSLSVSFEEAVQKTLSA